MKMNNEQREALRRENTAFRKASKWRNIEHLSMALWRVQRALNRKA